MPEPEKTAIALIDDAAGPQGADAPPLETVRNRRVRSTSSELMVRVLRHQSGEAGVIVDRRWGLLSHARLTRPYGHAARQPRRRSSTDVVTHTRRGRTASLGVGTPAESSARSTRERNRAQHCGYARRAWPTARNVNVTGRLSDGAAFMDQLSHVSASVVDGELMLFATLVGPALPVDGARLTAPVQRKFCTLPDGPNEPTHGCRRAAERGGSRLDRRPRAATHRRSTRP